MNPLEELIVKKIREHGPIPFETFMDMALYYPELGYYSCPETVIGRKGDFYTSPHLHPIFGAMLARQLMEMWDVMGRPSGFQTIEAGAGAGYLCKDIYDYLTAGREPAGASGTKHDFLDAMNYVIVEPYPHFREQQRGLLQHLPGKIREKISWVPSFNECRTDSGCILSNELLDAFPVHLVEMNDELREIYVSHDGSGFVEEKKPVSREISGYIDLFGLELFPGYRTEINLRIKDWLGEAAAVLSRGFILTVDYGYTAREYYTDDRTKGTLLCYHKHQFHENPYQHVGQQDITAHINFSSLKKWGEEAGLKTPGYCPQGTFLTASGIDEVIVELYADSPDYLSEISKIKGLIMPQGMGESHSVMVQYKGEGTPELRGFSLRNLAEKL